MSVRERAAAAVWVLVGLTLGVAPSDDAPRFLGWGLADVPYTFTEATSNPTTLAQWGLVRFAEGLTSDGLRAADWLVDNQAADGSWRYDMAWTSGRPVSLEPGWASGLAQGNGLSLLARAYELTGDRAYLTAMERAVRFFDVPISEGGVRTTLRGDLWVEEYPTDPPPYVLNGFMFAVLGLRDAAVHLPDAAVLHGEAMATLTEHRHLWETPRGVAYDLMLEEAPGVLYVNHEYDAIHEALFEELGYSA